MKDEWYNTWFESSWYLELYSHRTIDEAKTAVGLVQRLTDLNKGANVLDLCCGSGRHAAALSEEGFHVTGIDNSTFLIAEAKRIYGKCENLSFYKADMRDSYPNSPFDAVVNFFTSFGYFDEDCENESVILNIYSALKSRGYFLLDFFNAEYIKDNLVSISTDKYDNGEIVSRRRIENHQVIKEITITTHDKQSFVYHEKVHLYTKSELESMLLKHGFTVENCIGNYDGSEFVQETSPRCILVARK